MASFSLKKDIYISKETPTIEGVTFRDISDIKNIMDFVLSKWYEFNLEINSSFLKSGSEKYIDLKVFKLPHGKNIQMRIYQGDTILFDKEEEKFMVYDQYVIDNILHKMYWHCRNKVI